MLAALFIILTQAAVTCPACGTSGKDVRLCAPHADEERALFARTTKCLSSKDARERMAGLDELAQATLAHVNAPSKRVADRLGAALDDESYEVRAHAAELLGPPQNAVVALAGLLAAFRSTEGEREALDKELARPRAGSPRPKEGQVAELKREEAATVQKREALLAWRTALLGQLARFPDDRVVEAILRAPRGLELGGNKALVQLGSRRALQGVVDSMIAWEKELAGFAEVEKLISEDEADKLLADALRAVFQEEVKRVKATAALRLPELAQLVEERGLGPAPALSDHPAEAWQRWLDAHVAALPEHLPGVRSAVR